MLYAALGISIVLVILFIYVELKHHAHQSMLFKGLASLGFMFVYAMAVRDWFFTGGFVIIPFTLNTLIVYAVLLFLGLSSGLAGDLYLAIRPMHKEADKAIINGGILFFAIGHLFYFIGLLQIETFSYLSIIFGLIMAIVIYLGSNLLHFEMGKAKIPSLIYAFILFGLVGQSLSYVMQGRFTTFSIVFFVGALLFALSDLILAPIYFKQNKRPIIIILNYVTYYGAQILIALSLIYLR